MKEYIINSYKISNSMLTRSLNYKKDLHNHYIILYIIALRASYLDLSMHIA